MLPKGVLTNSHIMGFFRLNVDPYLTKSPPFQGLDIRILTKISTKGRGFINQGTGLGSFGILGA